MPEASPARWQRYAREPFFQFLLLGLLLFAAHGVWEHFQNRAGRTIIVDPGEMERRAILFAGENKRNPTEDELKALVYDYVQEEALVREARKLGLEEGDTIVRRRLAQKARFMLEDTVDIAAPDRETLCNFLEENPERFADPAKRSFAHIFLSPKTKSDVVLGQAAARLKDRAKSENWRTLGDPFLLNRSYTAATFPDVAKTFGPAFAKSLFALDDKTTEFQGPIESAFGLHLIRIDGVQAMVTPKCDAVLSELEKTWRADQRDTANAQSIRKIVERYEIVVDE